MADPQIEDVSDTALWVAAYRAQESERADALIHDPLASRLAGERGRNFAAQMPGTRQFAWSLVVRTRLIDDFIAAAVRAGTDLVLNLGAGLDTRPYRMALPPSLRWVEVDQPQIVRFKSIALENEQPGCRLERVALDLRAEDERDRLLAKLGSEAQHILVLTEGLIGYLSTADVASLARALHARPAIERWVTDRSSPFLARAMRRQRGVQRKLQNAPLVFDVSDWQGFFLEAGWKLAQLRYHVEEGQRLGRPVPLPRLYRWPMLIPGFREKVRTMMSVALLERVPTA